MSRDQNAFGGPGAIMGRRKGEGHSRNPGMLTRRPAQPNHRDEDLQLLGQRIVNLMSHRLGQVQQLPNPLPGLEHTDSRQPASKHHCCEYFDISDDLNQSGNSHNTMERDADFMVEDSVVSDMTQNIQEGSRTLTARLSHSLADSLRIGKDGFHVTEMAGAISRRGNHVDTDSRTPGCNSRCPSSLRCFAANEMLNENWMRNC